FALPCQLLVRRGRAHPVGEGQQPSRRHRPAEGRTRRARRSRESLRLFFPCGRKSPIRALEVTLGSPYAELSARKSRSSRITSGTDPPAVFHSRRYHTSCTTRNQDHHLS